MLLLNVSTHMHHHQRPRPVLKQQNILQAQQRSVTLGVLVQLKLLASGTDLLF